MPTMSLEMLFALFGMFLVVIGLAGGQRVKVISIEVGPLQTGWRAVAVGLGLAVLTAVGWVVLSKDSGQQFPHYGTGEDRSGHRREALKK